MTFYPNERIGLFIDGANLFSTSKALDFDIDYRKLLEEFRKRGRLVRANYYTALLENEDFTPLKPLVDWLDYNGFNVVTKPAKEFTDDSGRRRIKGDMDVELAVDIVMASKHLDHIILFTGDGDFRYAVEACQKAGARVTVVSSLKSHPPMISDDLRRQADGFIDLAELRSLVGRDGARPGRDDE
ncbi:NYN domain-containing protein [Hyphobacterium sp. HN65]|uniref:NYN domain-containing protein n=1 Tax=Hyphobacterium lacteum TaxID=3116575 RepID=A0ABU7LMB0_9PROT|nr:NYN domain-containing protein [Hyphobacterium sp. HN65]MEE2525060.1 NYN domain-containing protein [Hyphobacterium sp. HN65]